jgi:polyprenyldihydroxybenzoate methyltransferase/3-demethylubiquinol 3-O-methyltransferase
MNPLRHDFIASCLSHNASSPSPPNKHLRYLDVGCGGGIFAESAARLPTTSSVTAIDPSPSVYGVALDHAKTDPSLHNILTYHNTSIEAFPAPTTDAEKYDILSLFEVIEHVKHPAAFLELCFPFVKPGGWIVMSTIARTWTSWLTTKVVAEDLIGVVPRGTHEWSQYINEEELEEWFAKQAGWGDARAMGVMYVPGIGWKEISGGERWGNYFFGVRKREDSG